METIALEANGMKFTALAAGSGPVALCVHGFPDNLRSFRHQLPALAAAGYRAIAPALRGYEPATQPGREPFHFHPMRGADDVIAFAESFGGVHLIGHDWGGIIAYLAATERPDLFPSLTTLAIPHFQSLRQRSALHLIPRQLRNSWYVLFIQLRGIADRAIARRDFAFIERLWHDWSPGFRLEPGEMEAIKQTFREPGVLHSALGYYRAMLSSRLDDTRRMNALADEPIRTPTLAITGANDGCMDTRLYDHVPESCFAAEYRCERIPGAGHFVHQESPAQVNELLLQWLRDHPSGSALAEDDSHR